MIAIGTIFETEAAGLKSTPGHQGFAEKGARLQEPSELRREYTPPRAKEKFAIFRASPLSGY
jgi:hypothetical protein